eukprot:TRINITY_DN22939_c0_g2_i1.p1 TRINITY_DN22939_c0_g2~~TRINITY_DN22939_c0_g2_i1.p1  ORF type:complete len:1200 (+),score=216.18 TRINITY_DN22939_c0_g2_i1:2227-5826(+)
MSTPAAPVETLMADEDLRYRSWEVSSHNRALPTIDTKQITQVKMPTVALPDETIEKGIARTQQFRRKGGRRNELKLKIASVNVTSALDKGDSATAGVNTAGRTASLRTTFSDSVVHVVGLQESRTKEMGYRHNGDFLVAKSGCKPGAGALLGCEVWIKRHWVDGGGLDYFIDPQAVVITSGSPRHLLVSLTHSACTLDILSCHPPCKAPGTEIPVMEFWLEMVRLVRAHRRPHIPLVALFDANDTPVLDPPHVGEVFDAADAPPPMHVLLRELDLFLPYSMRGIGAERAPRPTCYNINMLPSCIDFIGLPMQWLPATTAATVNEEADVSLTKVDHLMVTADVTLPPKDENFTRSRRALPYDAAKAHAAEAAPIVAEILERIPVVDWSVDVTTQIHIFNTHILHSLKKAFPATGAREKPDWMPRSTKELLEQKALVFKEAVKLAKEHLPIPEHLRVLHRSLSNRLRAATRRDWKEAVILIQKEMADAFDANEVRAAWKRIGRLRPYKPKPALLLRREDGSRARDCDESADIMLDHWANKLEGEVVDSGDLLAQHQRDAHVSVTFPEAMKYIPTPDEIAGTIIQTKSGRAHGDDLIAIDILKKSPKAVGHCLHEVATKAMLTGHQPFHWQGGCMAAIPKGKGGPCVDLNEARGITLGSHPAKTVSKRLRRKMAADLETRVPDTVCGGLGGRGTDVALHTRQQFCELAQRTGCCAAVLFVDLSAAFDRMVRGDLNDAYEDANLNLIAAGLHRKTWAAVSHGDRIVHTRRGVRQGDPISDVCFIASVEKVVARVREDLATQCLGSDLLFDPSAKLFDLPNYDNTILGGSQASLQRLADVDYMDDVQLHIMDDTPEGLLERLTKSAQIVVNRFHEAGHEVNFAKSKTEAIVLLRGKRVREVRERLAQDENQVVLDTAAGPKSLRIVSSYLNLGNIQSFSAEANKQAKAAACSLKAASATITPATLANKHLPADTKRGLIDMMLTKGLCGSETWPRLEDRHIEQVAAPYSRYIRHATGESWKHSNEEMLTNAQLLEKGFVSMKTQMRLRRLRYLPRYVQKAPRLLRVLVSLNAAEAEKGGPPCWQQMMREDLAWLFQCSGKVQELGDPLDSTDKWLNFVALYPKQWKAIIRSTYEGLRKAEIKEPDPKTYRKIHTAASGDCSRCGRFFATAQALHLHLVKVHGARAPSACYAAGDNRCWSWRHRS